MFINRNLLSFMRGHWGKIVAACILQLLITVTGTLVSLGAAFVIRMLQGERSILIFTAPWQLFLGIAVLIGLRFVLAKRKALRSEECSLEIKADLRKRLLDKLFALGPAYLGKERTGNIASTISSKVEYLNEYYTIYLPTAISAFFNAAVILIVLASFEQLTALTALVGCIGLTLCPMLFYFLMRKRGEAEMQAHSQYYSDCLDSVQGMPMLKAFNANARQRRRIHEKGEELRKAVMSQMRVTMLENVVLQFFAGLGSAVSVAIAAWQCARGNMAAVNLVYALFLIGACFGPMTMLINAWHFGYRGVVASYTIVEMLSEPVRMSLTQHASPRAEPVVSEAFTGNIRFDGVTFAYNEEDGDVLRSVDFTIPNKTTTALVGPSGSGKSTAAHLLAGFYPLERGHIRVGELTLNGDTVSEIQDQISAVWQDCRLFYGTVRENIMVGKPGASQEEVEEAAKEASIHDFILSLPEGYATLLGERGLRFSGGERQRIALARAFLRNSPVLILDEATSSLDRRNEREIQRSLQKLSKGKTCLVIAHRLATIQSADNIILLDRGRIADMGTHEQLIASSAAYRALMGSQLVKGAANEA